ncbi:MerR family transcriptional regulator [Streptomyces rubiginosohelvolus]|uniref:MerR family transcriptional regulator n=1 Tax=Streptomyces rubiginosohelvolus TaxID=67362 RepID=UPI00386EB23D|nr:MerR family transcriptional regulator [Streptomyces rubiginosohelvolus]
MDWPISEVARMSGVTARTLRHYDEIGLLPPARIGSNGHRYYEEHQLLLLQQILVLRELGVGLPEIGRVLADQVDTGIDDAAGGAPADAQPVQAEIDAQYRALTSLHAVSADEYRAIGRSCVENEDWRAAYEAITPGLAEFQRDAIEVYAVSRLG